MSTSIVTGGGYMTLDGLLAALLFDELQDVEAAHAAIPVKNTKDLFYASSAVMEPIDKGRIAFIAALRQQHAIDSDLILKNKQGNLHRKFDSSFTNVLKAYRTFTAPTITWYVEGDADRIRSLLEPVQFIGKRRASGFGQVTAWDFEPDELVMASKDCLANLYARFLKTCLHATGPCPWSTPHGDRPTGVWSIAHHASCLIRT